MSKEITNGQVKVGPVPDTHFKTLEEFDVWFKEFRSENKSQIVTVTVYDQIGGSFGDYLNWLNKYDMAEDNMSATLTHYYTEAEVTKS